MMSKYDCLQHGVSSNDANVKVLKKLLMSRDVKNQLKAVSFILETLEASKDTKMSEFYIEKDIYVFLCEATATFHELLLKNILKCLKTFSTVKFFYKTSVSPHVVSSIVRSAHLLIKEDRLEETVLAILHLVSEIFIKLNNKLKLPPIISPESGHNAIALFELQCLIFKHQSLSFNIKIISGLILHIILKDTYKINIPPSTAVSLAQTVSANMEMLSQFLIDSNYDSRIKSKLDIVIELICFVSMDILELCIDNVNLDSKYRIDSEIRKRLQESCYNAVTNLVSEMKDLPGSVVISNYELFLNMLYKYLQPTDKHNFTPSLPNHLCSHNYLLFLPNLQFSNTTNKIKKLCRKNLVQLLFILSSENFNLEQWPEGDVGFFEHLNDGFSNIDCEWIQWPKKLNDNSPTAVKNSVIVYLYFYCLNSKSPQNSAKFLLPYLQNYVLNLKPNTSIHLFISKCLWFIFAMADLSNMETSRKCTQNLYMNKAVNKVSKIISLNIKDLYTHHPALVVWVFSSTRIPFQIQNQVLSFWLEKEKSLPNGLDSMDSVWCSLLNIVQTGSKTVAAIATDQLKICIEKNKEAENMNFIKIILWDALPEALTSFSNNKTLISPETIINLMELCSSNIPNELTIQTLQQTGFSLVSFICRCSNTESKNTRIILREAFCLLCESIKRDDRIVLLQFINSSRFLQYVYDCCKDTDEELFIEAVTLLSYLIYYTFQYNLEINNTIIFNPVILLSNLRNSNNSAKVVTLMQLLYTVITPIRIPKKQYLITFHSEQSAVNLVSICRSIFFRLQMIASKNVKQESNNALLCLNRMLEFASMQSDENNLIVHLTLQPWTHVLIKFFFSNYDPAKIHINMLKFIFNWLSCFRIVSKNCRFEINTNKTAIQSNTMQQTLLNILKNLDNEVMIKNLNEEKKKLALDIINLISTFFV